MANHERALEPALRGEVDLVVHGGDVFDRSRVAPSLVHQAFASLRKVADGGVPVFVVPGNHERSRIPHRRFAVHPSIHVFDRPRTIGVDVRGMRVAMPGFPNVRRDVRDRFRALVDDTGIVDTPGDIRLLCIHHSVEGATVGPNDFTFRSGADVIRGRDIPSGVAAVFSGHIHRHQVLTRDLAGAGLAAPVFYPGSVERTSLAEMDEEKGYLILTVRPGPDGGEVDAWHFERLPARPMIVHDVRPGEFEAPGQIDAWLEATLRSVPADAVLRIRVRGEFPTDLHVRLGAERVRGVAPATMNVEVVFSDEEGKRIQPGKSGERAAGVQTALSL